ncbi:MAG: GatB/YqeY domain-containing protein [Candidatus Omnitrophica bacterium]|nr:GatB/YqeY domain-containing protein [Candidatus Omnitrophota bacterium]
MLEEKILQDYKDAMKNKDDLKKSVLNFLRAELLNVAIAKKKNKLEDDEVVAVIRKQIKARQDSIEQFTKGARQDLADKEKKEMEILKTYLPQELSSEEIKQMVEETVVALAAQGLKDMGRVMKEVTVKIAGRADAKAVSDLVKERLCSEKK